MLAIISDIHSNTEALTAVLEDIQKRGVTQIVCLGDVVGYGPEPRQCLDMVRNAAATTLMGNHDYAVLLEPNKFNIGAEAACYWTRQQIDDNPDTAARSGHWDFLGSMVVKHVMDGTELGLGEIAFVHGSPRRPVNEYIFPDDVYNNPNKIAGAFDKISGLCFVGHTHVPGVFTDSPDFFSPDELENVYAIVAGRKAMVNVGSVGQPRDRDPRASYVLAENGKIHFMRVPYDVESVVKKVLAIPELDDYLGLRLREGR
jgi:predicted phosphodiesterase